jgi:hypothetical protein
MDFKGADTSYIEQCYGAQCGIPDFLAGIQLGCSSARAVTSQVGECCIPCRTLKCANLSAERSNQRTVKELLLALQVPASGK